MKSFEFVRRTAVVVLMLLLGVGSAQAATLVGPPTGAEGIDDLNVGGTLYNVAFVITDAQSIHGPPTGVYRFDTKEEAGDAVNAVNAFLNDQGVTGVTEAESELYKLAFDYGEPLGVPMAFVRLAVTEGGVDWIIQAETNFQVWTDETVYAQFEVSGGVTTTTVAATTTTGTGTTTSGAGTTTTSGATTTTVVQAAVCSSAPLPDCITAGKGSLKVNEKKAGKESVKVKVEKLADATTQASFGNPVGAGGTAYEICIWDLDGFVDSMLVDQAGQTCGKKSKECWKDKNGKGWQYKDDLAASDGVKKIHAKSGDAGKGKVTADAANKEKKGQTSMPTGIAAKLQGATGALVQVATSNAACFEALVTDVKKNDGVKFEGKVAKDGGGGEEPGPLCNEGLCAGDDTLSQKCEDFVEACLTFEEVHEEECAGGAIVICEGGPPPDVNPGNVCEQGLCFTIMDLADQCQMFLDTCLEHEDEDECVGGALFICREENL